ncbi:hypothetical protein [Lederbergia citrea]|uniref:hypothetical protein n=1 Tax=Lederbergia citrea TaxID=2833581 RepID=UPI001BC97763|nr:hypothetical protein [Lederbergia citrea]MBS4177410.1 hypothetical protein [Lederbergia citrea]
MKVAVVFGARQLLGYEFCVKLLEKGYAVNALDYAFWQERQHEERWLFIGRNANLQYFNIEDRDIDETLQEIEESSNNTLYYFFPLTDFYARDRPEIHEQLVFLLKKISVRSSISKSIIVFVQPSAIGKWNRNFSSEIETIKRDMWNKQGKIIEYCIPVDMSTEKGKFVYYQTNKTHEWQKHKMKEHVTDVTEQIISHLEEKILS